MPIPSIQFSHRHANQAELQVIDFAELYQREALGHNPQALHRIKFFGIIVINEGYGTHMVDFKEYQFTAGSVIFVQKSQAHCFDFSNRPQGKIIVFTQAFLDQLHANMRFPHYTPTHLSVDHSPLLQLDPLQHQNTQDLIVKMTQEIARSDSDPLIVMYLFSAFALSLQRLRPQINADKLSHDQSVRFTHFFELMQTHFDKTRDATWYALQLNTTYKTLNHICKLATGFTAKQLINAFTILEIKRRLVMSEATSQHIAHDLGFEDSSNFVKYFKKQVGSTPYQFTQKYKTPTL